MFESDEVNHALPQLKGRGVRIVGLDEAVDGGAQLRHRAEAGALQGPPTEDVGIEVHDVQELASTAPGVVPRGELSRRDIERREQRSWRRGAYIRD